MTTYYFQDLFVERTAGYTNPRQAYVFFHGFPGGGVRNEDLAKAVSKKSGATTFVVHFGGLGNGRGEFGFLGSVEQSLALVEEIAQSDAFDCVNLYGHSWGGLVAVNSALLLQKKLEQLVLVSPYSAVPDGDTVRAVLTSMRETDAGFPQSLDINAAVKDVATISARFNPRDAAPRIQPKRTLILQAKNDAEVPAVVNRSFVPLFKVQPEYLEVDQDHSFTNREALIALVTDWVR